MSGNESESEDLRIAIAQMTAVANRLAATMTEAATRMSEAIADLPKAIGERPLPGSPGQTGSAMPGRNTSGNAYVREIVMDYLPQGNGHTPLAANCVYHDWYAAPVPGLHCFSCDNGEATVGAIVPRA